MSDERPRKLSRPGTDVITEAMIDRVEIFAVDAGYSPAQMVLAVFGCVIRDYGREKADEWIAQAAQAAIACEQMPYHPDLLN